MRTSAIKIVQRNGSSSKVICENCHNLVPLRSSATIKGKLLCARCKNKNGK